MSAYLVEQGHDVQTVARDYAPGLVDREVLTVATREQRILITNDRDFGELIVRERLPHAGVMLFRLKTTDPAVTVARLAAVLREYPDQLDTFLVVTERRIRARKS